MQRVQEDIYELLKATREEMTISQIATAIDIERHTAAKFLEGLTALGLCELHEKGKSKLYKATPSPLFSMIEKDNPVSKELKLLLTKLEHHVSFQDANHDILWSNNKDHIGKKCYEVFAKQSSPCKTCDVRGKQQKHLTGSCGDHQLVATALKDFDNQTVGFVNIRK